MNASPLPSYTDDASTPIRKSFAAREMLTDNQPGDVRDKKHMPKSSASRYVLMEFVELRIK
jgi:hypothetical protein